MNCSQCGNALSPSAKFCNRCGGKQVLAPQPSAAAESTAPAAEKICGQCQAICKPHARFCPQCGNSFTEAAAATSAQAAPPVPEANIVVPPATQPQPQTQISTHQTAARQEPVFQTAAPELQASVPPSNPSFLRPAADKRSSSAPSFPQEPQASSQAWIKWAGLALIAAAIGGGILLAGRMSAFPGSSGNPSTPVPAVDKNAISAEDKARADALVGPQGVKAPPADSSTTIVISPDAPSDSPAAVSAAPAPQPSAPLSLPNTGADSRPAQTADMAAPTPRPLPKPKPQPKGSPSLDDLLD